MQAPSLPSPPTDNLYKFVALSGVVLVALGVWLWTSGLEEAGALGLDKAREIVELRTEDELLKRDEDFLQKQWTSWNSWVHEDGGAERSDEYHHHLAREGEKLSREFTQLRERLKKHYERLSESNLREAQYTQRLERIQRRSGAAPSFVLVGAGLMLWGFRRWYSRVQVYLDAQLKAEAESRSPAPQPETPVEQPAPSEMGDSEEKPPNEGTSAPS